MGLATAIIVTAHNEADRLPATLAALAAAFPDARVLVADDGSSDDTAAVAAAHGAEVVRSERNVGKGGAATLAAQRLLPLADEPEPPVVLLCDGDLAASADQLARLVEEVRSGRADLAIAAFARRVGGGVGLAVGAGRWAIRRRCGLVCEAPLSGQRALRASVLPAIVPFAARYGMEVGMTIDAVRAGHRVAEVELELTHRATGRTLGGFAHRGRQFADVLAAYLRRR